jgi:hypothetical protein
MPVLRLFKNLTEAGINLGEDAQPNNFCTQRLAALLEVPAP